MTIGSSRRRPPGTNGTELSIADLLAMLLRQVRAVVLLPVLVALVTVGIALLIPRTYTVSTAFMPQESQQAPSAFAGVVAQLGLQLPMSSTRRSPQFFAELLRSPAILRSVAEGRYAVGGSDSSDLAEIRGATGDTGEAKVVATVAWLRRGISVRVTPKTGVIRASFTTKTADLSRQIAERALSSLDRFNGEIQRAQATAERVFVEGRLATIREELTDAEERLGQFLARNRTYNQSPELVFQHDRLQRKVTSLQEVYTSLSQAYEQARLEEVRTTPVIAVIEEPRVPTTPDPRHLILKTALGLLAGGVLAFAVAFGREFAWTGRDQEREDYQRLAAAAADARQEIKRLLGRG